MQTSPQPTTPTPPPQAPRAPVTITTIGTDGQARTITLPRTRAEVDELLSQREELSDQLTSVASRRRNLAEEIFETRDATVRAGLEDRLRVLDGRILQLETDLATTGRQLSSAPADLIVSRTVQQSGGGGDFEEGIMIGGFSVLVAMSLALLFLRRRWKRSYSRKGGQLGADAGQRLERLEQGMDAIAIEIERVSEGQRFVTRLLSESHSPAGAGRLGEPVAVKSDPARRG
ncbi:MAG TPA: hypothetical protein VNO75_09735 [Gemmatimonadaceae bacterium]|nr:hypothetical protein [Gemmatimonadaceae bacterium]